MKEDWKKAAKGGLPWRTQALLVSPLSQYLRPDIRHCLVKSSMNYEGATTWADFRHEAGWSLEERYPRTAKYERKQYSITRTEDISVYSVIFGVCSWVKVQPKGGLPPHTNTIQASCIALHPALLHAPCTALQCTTV